MANGGRPWREREKEALMGIFWKRRYLFGGDILKEIFLEFGGRKRKRREKGKRKKEKKL